MYMRLRLFGKGSDGATAGRNRPRYVSKLQRDVQRYEGKRREDVESDYHASKTVHTILTLGYMEYIDDTLVLTERGGMLMRNVSSDLPPADRTVCYKF